MQGELPYVLYMLLAVKLFSFGVGILDEEYPVIMLS